MTSKRRYTLLAIRKAAQTSLSIYLYFLSSVVFGSQQKLSRLFSHVIFQTFKLVWQVEK